MATSTGSLNARNNVGTKIGGRRKTLETKPLGKQVPRPPTRSPQPSGRVSNSGSPAEFPSLRPPCQRVSLRLLGAQGFLLLEDIRSSSRDGGGPLRESTLSSWWHTQPGTCVPGVLGGRCPSRGGTSISTTQALASAILKSMSCPARRPL